MPLPPRLLLSSTCSTEQARPSRAVEPRSKVQSGFPRALPTLHLRACGEELRPASVAATLPSEKLHHCRYHVEVVDVHHGTARCSTADGHAYELVPLGRLKDMGDRRRRVPGVAGRDRFPGVVGDGARDWRPAWLGHFSVIVKKCMKEGKNY